MNNKAWWLKFDRQFRCIEVPEFGGYCKNRKHFLRMHMGVSASISED